MSDWSQYEGRTGTDRRTGARYIVRNGKLEPLPALGEGSADIAKGLRTEVSQRGGAQYTQTANAFENMRRAARLKTGAGDTTLVFTLMKTLDPTSTVSAGEYANARNAAGIPEKIRAEYNRLMQGDLLDDKTRMEYLNTGANLAGQAQETLQAIERQYEPIARARGVAPQEVFAGRPEFRPYIQTLNEGRGRRMFAREKPGSIVTDQNTGQRYKVGADGYTLTLVTPQAPAPAPPRPPQRQQSRSRGVQLPGGFEWADR